MNAREQSVFPVAISGQVMEAAAILPAFPRAPWSTVHRDVRTAAVRRPLDRRLPRV